MDGSAARCCAILRASRAGPRDNWSAKVEYLYLSYSGANVLTNWVVGGVQNDVDAHTIRFGINYRFGGYVSPVAARY